MAAPTTATATTRLSGGVRGILWMLFGVGIYVCSDAVIKHLVATYSPYQVLWARYIFITIFAAMFARRRFIAALRMGEE